MAPEIGRIGTWTPSSIWENAGDRDEAIAELEELGFGAVWLGSPRGDLELPDALLGASARMAVVPAIVNIWKYPAADVAAAYHRIDPQRRERLLVGLGSSHRPQVESAGIRYDKPVTRLEQYLDELDALPETISPGDRISPPWGRARSGSPPPAAPAHIRISSRPSTRARHARSSVRTRCSRPSRRSSSRPTRRPRGRRRVRRSTSTSRCPTTRTTCGAWASRTPTSWRAAAIASSMPSSPGATPSGSSPESPSTTPPVPTT